MLSTTKEEKLTCRSSASDSPPRLSISHRYLAPGVPLVSHIASDNFGLGPSSLLLPFSSLTLFEGSASIAVPLGRSTALTPIWITALDEFHANKHAIIAAGVRQGKGGKVIDNWQIPKLELMQSVISSICNSGVIAQWSADVTEHAHITEVKDPARASNNNNYNPQICRYLDRADNLLDCSEDSGVVWEDNAEEDEEIDEDVNDFPAELLSPSRRPGQPCPITNYFLIAKILQEKEIGSVPIPLRSFVIGRTALNLAYTPSIKHATVDEIAIMFGLPDLRLALADFVVLEELRMTDELPFDQVPVWFKIRLQETEFHNPHGRYDTVIIQTSSGGHSWPASGLSGHSIAQIRLVIRPLGRRGAQWAWEDKFLTYVQRFNISSERDPTTQFHTLKRAMRSNGTRMGEIIPVSQFRAPIHPVPRFGATADTRLTAYNSMEHPKRYTMFLETPLLNTIDIILYSVMAPIEHSKTVDFGIKLALLMSAPHVSDVPTLDKLTDLELNHLIVEEEEPADAVQPLSHMLTQIFRTFTLEVPDATELQRTVDGTGPFQNRIVNPASFSYLILKRVETEENSGANKESGSGGTSGGEGPAEVSTTSGDTSPKPHTLEDIFSSFFNTTCGAVAQEKPNEVMAANSGAVVHTWSAHNSTRPVKDQEVSRKPDLALLDDVEARWDTIKAPRVYWLQPFNQHIHEDASPCSTRKSNISPFYEQTTYMRSIEGTGPKMIIDTPESDSEIDPDVEIGESLPRDPPQLDIPQDPLRTTFSDPIGRIIVNNHAYDILEVIFSSQGLVGRGTVCYLARRDDEEYIIKDHWVLGSKDAVLNEVEMLWEMQGVHGVPELVEYWLVEIAPNEVDETMNYRYKVFGSIKGTSHTHVHLVLKPRAQPLHAFQTKLELVAVEDRRILHRDCSLNNAMIKDDGDGTNGMLIDWEFAVHMHADQKYTIGGTLSEAVGNVATSARSWKAKVATGPLGVRRDLSAERSQEWLPHLWAADSFKAGSDVKTSFFFHPNVDKLKKQFHPHFKTLLPLATQWYDLMRNKGPSSVVTFQEVLHLVEAQLAKLPKDKPSPELLFAKKVIAALPKKRHASDFEGDDGNDHLNKPSIIERGMIWGRKGWTMEVTPQPKRSKTT
ncbi:hypothetical protein DFJ58DRAFT_844372 [Suillus subalutaceus]|uniref:uncharacterized protein n=1 Tax=Suillus subalutaceus TaxID=48586 RepID=UPI001B86E871|nr:uncharacterized protein DFJ58DRAFT_844372 [Suillus subalutaceus]KAG1843264.1 hypothetical protein DFJ58DRAFT_844372 [Suillus subalutaceus]